MSAPLILSPATNVKPPKTVPTTVGLIALANHPDTPDERWIGGYRYRPELPAKYVRARSGITGNLGPNLGTDLYGDIVHTIPVMLTAEDQISAFQVTEEDYEDRVKRIIEANSSRLLERELWEGDLAQQDNLPNRRLASPDAVDVSPGTPLKPQAAAAYLMQALSDVGMGVAMIHASKRVGIQFPETWRRDFTKEEYGFITVVGEGYTGTGPDGTGTNWIYATEMVNVRLAEPEVLPDTLAAALDKSDNLVKYYGQRIAAADFAGPVFACQVTAS